jgi:streptogrisin C
VTNSARRLHSTMLVIAVAAITLAFAANAARAAPGLTAVTTSAANADPQPGETPAQYAAAGLAKAAIADPDTATVDAYEEATGLPVERAVADLKTQADGHVIDDALRSSLGADYAGIWFNPKNGSMVVPYLADDVKLATSQAEAAKQPGTKVQFQLVDHTWSDLEAAVDYFTNNAPDLIAPKQRIRVGIDTPSNGLVIQYAADLASADLERVQKLAAQTTIPIRFNPVPADALESHLTSCSFPNCSRPLRGAVYMEDATTGCSTGFVGVRPSPPDKVIIDAGHCEAGTWRAFDSSTGSSATIGSTIALYHDSRGDGMTIKVNGSGYWGGLGGVANLAAAWGADEVHTIYGSAWSYANEFFCNFGARSAGHCGNAIFFDVTVSYPNEGLTIGHLTLSNSCSERGDSGGPAIDGNTGIGTITGASNHCTDSSHGMQFQEVRRTEGDFGVYVAGS